MDTGQAWRMRPAGGVRGVGAMVVFHAEADMALMGKDGGTHEDI